MSLMSFLTYTHSYEIETTAQALIGIGTSCLCFIVIFQHRSIFWTKNTIWCQKSAIWVRLFGCLFLTLAGILGLVLEHTHRRASVPLLSCGAVLVPLNIYTLVVKKRNTSLAKKAGMSEAEYWEKEIVPNLKLKEDARKVLVTRNGWFT